MDPTALLQKYFVDAPEAGTIVLQHSRLVAAKALWIADNSEIARLDRQFIEEAALLHDIGVCRVHAIGMGLTGKLPYICHGILGKEILEKEGLPRHALVCERHIGVGLSIDDIRTQRLPLPHREMLPVSWEERIVCCADLFYSKHPGKIAVEKSLADVKQSLARFGSNKVSTFETWQQLFSLT